MKKGEKREKAEDTKTCTREDKKRRTQIGKNSLENIHLKAAFKGEVIDSNSEKGALWVEKETHTK